MAKKKRLPASDMMRRFAQEYLLDISSPMQAAIRAGYSPRTASSRAHDLLKEPRVQALIQKGMNERAVRTEINSDIVIQEIAKLGFSNMQDFYDKTGQLIPVHELPRHIAAAISEVTEKVIGSIGEQEVLERKYKLIDKKGSLELLGRNLKLFTDKTELTGADGQPLVTDTKWEIEIVRPPKKKK